MGTLCGLWLADQLLVGLQFTGVRALFLSALGLGVVNTLIRPLLLLLTLPITVITLGTSILVINALMLALVAAIVPGFHLRGVVAPFVGALVVSVASGLVTRFFDSGREVHPER